ncbi:MULTISPECIES: SCP2 sterol-binding domain-containing protein [unclassified Pseudomonas]|uniref:ubiquinone biosynthesis accessory factor UbiJ n=1 Tax=unclassified Pseudomonas TaxID=196821 RepID=UPI002AC95C47|nr:MULTISPECIES: SCP2 sterol-binding domain-containing protein [unclassified Pseudomonas]MEB0042175.1 SCP2 sterol-binding domain-containing protein [Pseudomonas sp. MH10]MEB0076936.1 SCP2 sterol-binding domain-containing protein [Pseudomonas sp. MH10out]MEB0094126.1 SCP2 sterol-binding domain-containing protein [Pseudomonas sp. CCI4.2]MEB0102346.1 SCP2 sterol-binding domain-containing protein [Pseudomonas sp. CCI3.2]MEB0123447.1 SCP2 sterol-binding domain-containing protein [Pseudomonas sp. CC
MILRGLLASVEHGINRVLRMDSTALPRLERLTGKVVAVDCRSPALQLFILPSNEGLLLAAHWEAEPDCTLRAPASTLLRLAMSQDKTAVLHGPDVELEGDSAVLLELAGVLQDLELDWEYELSRWLGPIASPLLSGHLRSSARWTRDGVANLTHNLADYLSEESRTLVGHREAQARFAELDQTKQDLERLEARVERLALLLKPSDNA